MKRPSRHHLISVTWLFALCIYWCRQPNSRSSGLNIFLSAVRSCSGFATPVEVATDDLLPYPIPELLSQVDHIFIVSLDTCRTKLPLSIVGKSTCIVGRKVDDCAPSVFLRGAHAHAMKVSFTHAVILQISHDASYDSVAILEDDIEFIHRRFNEQVVEDFTKLLREPEWSVVRLGFRPFFLQERGNVHCPNSCRCFLSENIAGEHFCQLRKTGCDLRSSDMYAIHAPYFLRLQSEILNLDVTNSKRIVDLYPMRSLPHQWLLLPQVSFQKTLDIPPDYQIGLGALYVKKCTGPRPLPPALSRQLHE